MLLPNDVSALSAEEQQHIYKLEQAMLEQEVPIPVFFSRYSDEFNDIIADISIGRDAAAIADTGAKAGGDSALRELINSVSANGYQIVVTGAVHTPSKSAKIPIIQGELGPQRLVANAPPSAKQPSEQQPPAAADVPTNSKLPLIIITAHMDTFGLTQEPLSNVDAAVLLTLVDTFSKLYSSAATAPKYRLMFILTEAGNLLNYQGTKKWIESNLEENTAVQNAEFVLCLDGIGHRSRVADSLYVHVSRPPKDGTPINAFYKQLKRASQLYGNVTVDGVHKKVNLADVQLAWEHERFSMKRMQALSLSGLKSHKDAVRHTMFEVSRDETLALAQRNAKIVAEALGAYVYGGQQQQQDHGELFSGSTVSRCLCCLHRTIFESVTNIIRFFVTRPSPRSRCVRGCRSARRCTTTMCATRSKST